MTATPHLIEEYVRARSRRTARAAWSLLLLTAGCGGDESGGLRATLVRPLNDTTRDTVRFEAPAVAHACAGGAGVLLSGARTGNGVLLLIRPRDSGLTGAYIAQPRGDTVGRGALVAARVLIGDVARGVSLDSGGVSVSVGRDGISATVRGSGLGVPGAMRLALDAAFENVSPPLDTVPCGVEP